MARAQDFLLQGCWNYQAVDRGLAGSLIPAVIENVSTAFHMVPAQSELAHGRTLQGYFILRQ